jgi:hypothetical protein
MIEQCFRFIFLIFKVQIYIFREPTPLRWWITADIFPVGKHISSCEACFTKLTEGALTFKDFEILKQCRSKFDAEIHEALLIKKLRPKINTQLFKSGAGFGGHFGGQLVFFKITVMFYIIFDSFIGSGMVENIYLDTKIITLSSLLRKLEVFLHIFGMLGGPFGGHLVF